MLNSKNKLFEVLSNNKPKESNLTNLNQKNNNQEIEKDQLKNEELTKQFHKISKTNSKKSVTEQISLKSFKKLNIVQDHTAKKTKTDESENSEDIKPEEKLPCFEQNYTKRLESLQKQLKLKVDTDFLLDFSKYDMTKSYPKK